MSKARRHGKKKSYGNRKNLGSPGWCNPCGKFSYQSRSVARRAANHLGNKHVYQCRSERNWHTASATTIPKSERSEAVLKFNKETKK